MRYKGTYRLRTPIDLSKNTFPREYTGLFADNDIYIDCYHNCRIFHYGKQILQYYCPSVYRGRNIIKSIKEQFQGENIINCIEETDSEVLFRFNSKYLDQLSPILKPKKNGADISPFSNKNLPKVKYDIPIDDLKQYKDITSVVTKDNLLLISKLTKLFLESLCNKNYTIDNLKDDMALKCLKGKEYIHSIGKWEEFLKFLERNIWK